MSSDEFDGLLRGRLAEISRWLVEQPAEQLEEQRHLDAGSVERLYWHRGYYQALNDVERARAAAAEQSSNRDTSRRIPRAAPGGRNFH